MKDLTRYILLCIIILAFYSCGQGGNSSNITGGATGTNSAILNWDPPATNVDGTPLTDLAGYKIYYGTTSCNVTSSCSYDHVITIDDPTVTSYEVTDLQPGTTYYFAVTAFDTAGNESDYSNEVSKTIPP